MQAAKPSLTLQVAKASLTVLRSSRHRRPQRPKRNRAALPSVRDSNTSIRPHPTTSRPDRRATRDASDHPSTRVDHDKRGRPMFACVVGFAPRALCAAGFAPPARVWFAPPARWAAGIYPRIDRAPRSFFLGQNTGAAGLLDNSARCFRYFPQDLAFPKTIESQGRELGYLIIGGCISRKNSSANSSRCVAIEHLWPPLHRRKQRVESDFRFRR